MILFVSNFPIGAFLDEESDDEYDEELDIKVGNFRTEAAGVNPASLDDLDYNLEEGGSQAATPTPVRNRGSSRRSRKDEKGERSDTILSLENVKGTIDVWWLFDDGGIMIFKIILFLYCCFIVQRSF